MRQPSTCLIFDADDTLWENNIYFEAAIEEFMAMMLGEADASSAPLTTADRQRILLLLLEIERESIPRNGYGSRHFINSLKDVFQRLCELEDGREHLQAIDRIGHRLVNHPMVVMPGVADTLDLLRRQHRLVLFTKGDFHEQSAKVESSGLKEHFDRVEVVREKDIDAYHALADRCRFDKERSFMIGNSPRSDIFPALDAGLWAVFVPHAHTWELEHDDERLHFLKEVEPHPRLLHATSLSELPALLASHALFQKEPKE